MESTEYKRSKLLPIGIIMIAVGLLAPMPVEMIARSIQPHGGTGSLVQLISGTLLIGSDLIRILFFAGIACAIIGALRNRKERNTSSGKIAG
jgi:K+-transporting ATPase c subunit